MGEVYWREGIPRGFFLGDVLWSLGVWEEDGWQDSAAGETEAAAWGMGPRLAGAPCPAQGLQRGRKGLPGWC